MDLVQLQSSGPVFTLTLNHPEKRNAMTPELTEAFARAVAAVRAEPEARVLIVTGNGPAFCAGGDLGDLEERLDAAPEANRRHMGDFYRTYLALLHLDLPTIAAINGAAVGAGLSLALACDMRLAAEGARLGFTFLNLGLHPGMGATHLLPLLVGSARAAELLFTGKVITAAEAAAMGLVNGVVPPEQLMEAVQREAGLIAAKPAAALRITKRALLRDRLRDLEAVLDYEALAQSLSFQSTEMREGIAAIRWNR